MGNFYLKQSPVASRQWKWTYKQGSVIAFFLIHDHPQVKCTGTRGNRVSIILTMANRENYRFMFMNNSHGKNGHRCCGIYESEMENRFVATAFAVKLNW